MGRQLRVLDAGDERPEIEARGGFRRRRQTAVRLALRRVELEFAVVEADEERVVVRQPVVDAAGERLVGDLAVGRRDVVVETAAGVVRQRIDAGDVPADREDAVLRNDVVGKLIAHGPSLRVDTGGERIVNRDQVAVAIAIVAEIADTGGCRRHGIHRRHATLLLDSRVIGEEERAAVAVVEARDHQRAANRAAELMPVERRHRILDERAVRGHDFAHEEVAGVERVVAHELVGRAVQLVGARFGRHRDHAGAAPELGGEDAREHLEFTDLFDRWGHDDGVEGELVVVDAVDEPRVGVGLTAERVEVRRAARIEGAGAREVLARLPGRNPRREVDEGREVASVQRQFLDRNLFDDGPDFRRVGAHERRFGQRPSSLPSASPLRASRRF